MEQTRVIFKTTRDWVASIDRVAKHMGVSRSMLIRKVLSAFVEAIEIDEDSIDDKIMSIVTGEEK